MRFGYAQDLKVSVIVPCDAQKHVSYLYDLLERYEQQTILPHEVILSISNTNQVNQDTIKKIINNEWSFPLKYILEQEPAYAGENRNKGCEIATGDIFLFQDADDIPINNSIEVIKYFFTKHQVDHAMHLFIFPNECNEHFSIVQKMENIRYIYPKSYENAWNTIKKFHNGNIAIRSNVFKAIRWTHRPKGQDFEFNEKVYKSGKFKCAIILEPLIIYRLEYSSWKKLFSLSLLDFKRMRNYEN